MELETVSPRAKHTYALRLASICRVDVAVAGPLNALFIQRLLLFRSVYSHFVTVWNVHGLFSPEQTMYTAHTVWLGDTRHDGPRSPNANTKATQNFFGATIKPIQYSHRISMDIFSRIYPFLCSATEQRAQQKNRGAHHPITLFAVRFSLRRVNDIFCQRTINKYVTRQCRPTARNWLHRCERERDGER